MIEDVLEQLVEDYYSSKPGFFTKHNIKFRPAKSEPLYDAQMDSVHSDIDVIAISTDSPRNVYAVSCKSWQGGFNISTSIKCIEEAILQQPIKTKGKRDLWCTFRELCIKKWTKAFVEKLRSEIALPSQQEVQINYSVVCTRITPASLRDKDRFENSEIIKKHFKDTSNAHLVLSVLTFNRLIKDLIHNINNKTTPSVEMTELSRTIQLLIASGCKIEVPDEG